jgi:hypothetical protein
MINTNSTATTQRRKVNMTRATIQTAATLHIHLRSSTSRSHLTKILTNNNTDMVSSLPMESTNSKAMVVSSQDMVRHSNTASLELQEVLRAIAA